MLPWQPTASLANLQARAALLQYAREFFAQRAVLEVETPLLSQSIGSDPNLNPISTKQGLFLQTSPEFAMKRLLASGSGPIFQVCKAFREGEAGSKHNPEFTMLEWYRPGLDHMQLMEEVEEFVAGLLDVSGITRRTYREIFQDYLDIDPHLVSIEELQKLAARTMDVSFQSDDVDVWLDLLYSQQIEPKLEAPVFIYNYPKSQAALAKIVKDEKGVDVAQRFELVIGSVELANGYFELTDPQEQQRRFALDQKIRLKRNLPQNPLDDNFLAALQHGLPECSGVALGLDRLLMLVTQTESIENVLTFPVGRA